MISTRLTAAASSSLVLVLLLGAGISQAATPSRTETVLLTCSTMKWSSVELISVQTPNPSKPGTKLTTYELVLEKGSRERQSVGAYTESRTPIFFTNNAEVVKYDKKSNGEFVLKADFVGTQPMNASATALTGKLGSASGELEVRLENARSTLVDPSKDIVASTNSFDFFSGRWTQFIQNDEVMNDPTAPHLVCSWVK